MKRVITGLSLLLLLLCGATAQSISQYEYWTDDDYANRKVSSATGSNISLVVSTEKLEAGVHFLNFRACRNDGVWGNFYRYLYYIPTLKSAASGDVNVKYWMDDELVGAKSETASGGNLSLTIDVSALKPGVHYFNCTPVATSGEWGNSERYLFYVPQTFDLAATSPIKGFEYWLDDNYSSKKVEQSGSYYPLLTIGIGELGSGVHYFNCRPFNERGEYGNPVREMFYIPSTQTFSDAKLTSYEYWFDDDYAHCVKGNSANTSQAFTIDVSQLSSGVHYFNYWPIDDKGRRGNVKRQMFYVANIVDQTANEQIEYEYWIDSDTEHKVTGMGTTGILVFNIDVAALDKGTHTFNFKAKDMLEQWGPVYTETFEIKTVLPTYKLTYIVDGKEYKSYNLVYGATIIPESAPTKEGCTFSGWSEIPETMPDHDVIVTGSFSNNKYIPGDVNDDGSVSVTDVGCTINYILEQVPSVFIFEAADMNGDKSISVTDVGMIINLILSEGAASRQMEYHAIEEVQLALQPTADGYQMLLENKDAFIGFQFDVQLPDYGTIDGVMLTGESDHLLTYRQLYNGKWRVVCYSPTNSIFGTFPTTPSGDILLMLCTKEDVCISNIRFTTAGLDELCIADLVGTPTGIASVSKGIQISVKGRTMIVKSDHEATLQLYSLDGSTRRILNVRRGQNKFDGLRAGIYMIDKQKVIIR